MKLLWKLLKQHISLGQFSGFVFANLFGMIIVLAGYQFYRDILPIFTSEDAFMKADFLLVTKHVGVGTTLSGGSGDFTEHDLTELKSQPFVKKVGVFTSTNYKIGTQLTISGQEILNTEMNFESVPDAFVDIDMKRWHYTDGDEIVPIILPRSYINMYNFGFAQSHGLPQISDDLMHLITLQMHAHGSGKKGDYKGKVVAFSNSLNSILVPQAFMDYTNSLYAPNDDNPSTRLLMEVTNPADEQVTRYMDDHGYEMESDKLNQEKTTYFLRMVVSLVMVIGVIISALSFYILMLSIYLLVQKNTRKLQNLLLIGYSPAKVALPYQLLTAGLNVLVLAVAIGAVIVIRMYYMKMIVNIYPETAGGTLMPAIILGGILFCIVTLLNVIIIRRKIASL